MKDPLSPTIFHEDWWLKAATNNNYDEVLIHVNGKTVGRLPFIVTNIRGRRTMCQMPNLTHFLGPGMDDGNGLDCNRALKRDLIVRELVEKLPKTSGFYQKMHRGIKDVITFQQVGFQSSVEFTYELHPKSLEALWNGLRDKTRNVIRRASEQLSVSENVDPEEFINFYDRNLVDRDAVNSYDVRCSINLCKEAVGRDRGRVLAIRNKLGMLDAAIFYIWDHESAYYFMSARSREAHNGAIAYLVWRAILDATSRNIIFDFDGLGTKGSNLFYIGFGGQVAPRYTVHRAEPMHAAIALIGRFVRDGAVLRNRRNR
ncbi:MULTISPECIES: hypothetical protein [Methylobacterium]|uniref:hypothetical protein n=1 Tax=Methylobacterium TaxID=407 RepID=UPI002F35BA7B